jgi:ribonucleoside-diphosphate reductase alpha chain
VFDEIAEGAWKTGDPGLVFIDRRNRGFSNPVPALGPIEATNPCGEQELYPFDACNLGSIFLTYFVKEEKGVKSVDWEKLKNVAKMATRFLDNVIEVNPFPLEEIRQTVFAIRRIGLGIGGWADMLVALGIPYDSEEALALADKVMKTVQETAIETTRELARERGAFPLWPISIYKKEAPRRNSTVTTIAPTGSISIIAGASSGIEPLFAIAFQHIVKDKHLDRKRAFVNPKFEEIARQKGFWSEEIKVKVSEEGVIRGIEEIPAEVRALFGTAHEIDPEWHVKVQAVFQKYTENAVSKTINLRHDSTVEDVKKAYLMAWETNCKGITVFRDGSKDAQVLNLGLKEKEEEKEEETGEPLKTRPFKVLGSTYKMHTPVGSAFITINQDETGDPLEIFINVGKAGSDVAAMAEALGRTISTALRFRGSLSAKARAYEIAKQLSGIGGRRSVGFGANKIRSLPDAIAAALSSHYGFKINGNGHNHVLELSNGSALAASNVAGAVMAAVPPTLSFEKVGQDPLGNLNDPVAASAPFNEAQASQIGDICPSCGASSLVYEEGCVKCYSCGHSEC